MNCPSQQTQPLITSSEANSEIIYLFITLPFLGKAFLEQIAKSY